MPWLGLGRARLCPVHLLVPEDYWLIVYPIPYFTPHILFLLLRIHSFPLVFIFIATGCNSTHRLPSLYLCRSFSASSSLSISCFVNSLIDLRHSTKLVICLGLVFPSGSYLCPIPCTTRSLFGESLPKHSRYRRNSRSRTTNQEPVNRNSC